MEQKTEERKYTLISLEEIKEKDNIKINSLKEIPDETPRYQHYIDVHQEKELKITENLMKQFNLFLERFGVIGLFRLPFYPLTLAITSPFVILATIWNSLKIFAPGSARYIHFHSDSAISEKMRSV